MKKLSVDDAIIYLFAHQDKDNPVQFPDTLVYVVDMYAKYRTNSFVWILQRIIYKLNPLIVIIGGFCIYIITLFFVFFCSFYRHIR